MLQFYDRYFVPFGEVLTDMERAGAWRLLPGMVITRFHDLLRWLCWGGCWWAGIRVDAKDYLAKVQKDAERDKETALQR